jgi:COP9 signalosome complex subunit 1
MQNYASSYTGHAKVNRLIFIAEKTADAQLSLAALRIAADELKKVALSAMHVCATDHDAGSSSPMARVLWQGLNTMKYSDVIGKINGRLGPDYQYDRSVLCQQLP